MMTSPPTIHARISNLDSESYATGIRRTLFTDYGHERASAFAFDFYGPRFHHFVKTWAGDADSISIVESGSGELVLGDGSSLPINLGYAFYTPNTHQVMDASYLRVTSTDQPLRITSLQLPSQKKVDSDASISVVDPSTLDWKIFEYEALGKEIITAPDKKMGLLQLAFPSEKIPLHIHPYSDRFIRTISGKGFVYVEPYKYSLGADDAFIAFPRGDVHTNGPQLGDRWVSWSFHFPWVDPEVDEENVGGSEAYARYISAPPKSLWKTKEELLHELERKR